MKILFHSPFKFLSSKIILLILGLLLMLNSGCQRDKSDPIPDVSHIEVEVAFIHFDNHIRDAWSGGLEGVKNLLEKYPEFSEIYFGGIMEIWSADEAPDSLYFRMQEFLESPFYETMSDTINLAFSNMGKIKDKLESAFRFYHYYFPERNIPSVYFFVSEFTYGNVIFEKEPGIDALGIGLDMFLHGYFDYSVLSFFNTAFAAYNMRTLDRAHLPKKTMDVIWDDILGPPPMGRTIDLMLYYAKKHHLNKLTLPYTHDSIIFEYTPEQLEWTEANEAHIYNYLIEEDLLYTTDMGRYARLVNPAPHSAGMPPEAPGRVVNWLAYKMLRAWIRNNPDKTLEDLISLTDGDEFLRQSRYRPGRY
ncbi:MAG: hypothetical protein EA362_01740 [Saprospirales bacterium]|nr:MAG: hypothetical protein EA362_01740 [Saprospirales bacterium]